MLLYYARLFGGALKMHLSMVDQTLTGLFVLATLVAFANRELADRLFEVDGFDRRWAAVPVVGFLGFALARLNYEHVLKQSEELARLRQSLSALADAEQAKRNATQRDEMLLWSLDSIRREGENLVERSHGTLDADPTFPADFDFWKAKAHAWIEGDLGAGYAARFEAEAGTIGRPNGTFIDFLPQAWSLSARLSRISEFITEIGTRQQ